MESATAYPSYGDRGDVIFTPPCPNMAFLLRQVAKMAFLRHQFPGRVLRLPLIKRPIKIPGRRNRCRRKGGAYSKISMGYRLSPTILGRTLRGSQQSATTTSRRTISAIRAKSPGTLW